MGCASGCEAKVVDAARQELADGVSGDLATLGPKVMLAYYRNQETTHAGFTPEVRLRTGDLDHRDAAGFSFVTGRIRALILKGGENIALREIDAALRQHPDARGASGRGGADRHYRQEMAVCVVLRAPATRTKDELRVFCQRTRASCKPQKHGHFVDNFSRGPTGKVQRLKLTPSPE